MKICYFADGESIHVVRWCNHFSALGHDVHLVTFKNVSIPGTTTHYIDSGAISVGGGNWKVLLKFRKVKAILKKIKPDVFHAMYATSHGITGALCNYHPYIITCFGTDVLISGQQPLYRSLLKFAFSKADWINSLAPHMSEAIRKIGADMSKVEVIPFGIDIDIFNDKNRNPDDGAFTVLSNRNHEPVYNIPYILKAIAKAKPRIPNLRFVVTGDGSMRKELEELAVDLDIMDITEFLGRITQQEMVSQLSKANVFVTVSFSDGNSLSLAEALSSGTLCIASEIPANTQWITDGENGFLVPVDDVDVLAEKLVFAYNNYEKIQNKAVTLNHAIISKDGVWKKNMDKIERKYRELAAAMDRK